MIIYVPPPIISPYQCWPSADPSYLYIFRTIQHRPSVSIRWIVFVYSRQWRILGLRPAKWTGPPTHCIVQTASQPASPPARRPWASWCDNIAANSMNWNMITLCVFRRFCFNIQSIAVFQIDIRPYIHVRPRIRYSIDYTSHNDIIIIVRVNKAEHNKAEHNTTERGMFELEKALFNSGYCCRN